MMRMSRMMSHIVIMAVIMLEMRWLPPHQGAMKFRMVDALKSGKIRKWIFS